MTGDMGFPAAPEIHVTQSEKKEISIELTPHGVVVNVSTSLIQAGIATVGLALAARANADLWGVLSGLGLVGGAAWTLFDSLRGSNRATERLYEKEGIVP
jgi:hypothetical protein